jgi:hypothetical protein
MDTCSHFMLDVRDLHLIKTYSGATGFPGRPAKLIGKLDSKRGIAVHCKMGGLSYPWRCFDSGFICSYSCSCLWRIRGAEAPDFRCVFPFPACSGIYMANRW